LGPLEAGSYCRRVCISAPSYADWWRIHLIHGAATHCSGEGILFAKIFVALHDGCMFLGDSYVICFCGPTVIDLPALIAFQTCTCRQPLCFSADNRNPPVLLHSACIVLRCLHCTPVSQAVSMVTCAWVPHRGSRPAQDTNSWLSTVHAPRYNASASQIRISQASAQLPVHVHVRLTIRARHPVLVRLRVLEEPRKPWVWLCTCQHCLCMSTQQGIRPTHIDPMHVIVC